LQNFLLKANLPLIQADFGLKGSSVNLSGL
jgi:hypothetical protein